MNESIHAMRLKKLIWRAASSLRLLHDNYWDAKLKIKTNIQCSPNPKPGGDYYSNVPTPYFLLLYLNYKFKFSKSFEKILDVGSGAGRVVAYLNLRIRHGLAVGVEIDEDLAKFSQRQLASVGLDKVIFNCDVNSYSLESFDCFFLFNPFRGEVMHKFIQSLKCSLESNPRQITIILFNPESESLFLKSFQTNIVFRYNVLGHKVTKVAIEVR